MLSTCLDQGIVLLPNILLAVVFRLVLNYTVSVECLIFDHLAGLSFTESLLELHLASLFLANLYIDEMVQWLYTQSLILLFWEWVTLTPVSVDYLIPDLVGDMSSMSGSKSGASICIVSPEFICGSRC